MPNGSNAKHYKQLGLYGLTKNAIIQYARMDETPLEIAEADDMLRFIENGIPVRAVLSPFITKGVDTPLDKEEVSRIMERDPLFKRYGKNRSKGASK